MVAVSIQGSLRNATYGPLRKRQLCCAAYRMMGTDAEL
jgi:hypothetical protein